MAVKFTGTRLDIGARIVNTDGQPTPKFQRDWQGLNAAIADSVGQIDVILTQLAEQQTLLEEQQTALEETQDAQQDIIDQIVDILNGTTNFTGIKIDSKRVDNFVAGLDADGQRIVDTAVVPLNVPSGAARSYDSYPLTSNDSSITVGSVGFDEPGSAGSLTGGSVSGLSSNSAYRVFYNPVSNFYTAQPPPAGIYFSSPDGWQYIGDIKTTAGGVYSPPAALPDGFDPGYYSGGMTIF